MLITALYALPLVLLVIALASRVVLLRRSHKVGIGTGENPELARAIRVHGNAIEIVPLALSVMLLAELAGAWPWLLHLAGALLVIGRAWHAVGLAGSAGYSPGRFMGTALTWTVTVVMAFTAVIAGLAGQG